MVKRLESTSWNGVTVDVIIPAFNEENAVGQVIDDLPVSLLRHVVVCDNGSTDDTAQAAQSRGAVVVYERQKGYGSACQKGLAYLGELEKAPDIVVFLDADYSDYPDELPDLVWPIMDSDCELVIGSRVLGNVEKGALTIPQRFGNRLATVLMRIMFGVHFTDLGPFRAVRYESLKQMNMKDPDYGWTVEMQIKAAQMGMKCKEVPVSYRKRIGTSKVSGTVRGVIGAGTKILGLIFWYGIMKRS
jgi:glycosyltransferase involved in cell wall biosynthesis